MCTHARIDTQTHACMHAHTHTHARRTDTQRTWFMPALANSNEGSSCGTVDELRTNVWSLSTKYLMKISLIWLLVREESILLVVCNLFNVYKQTYDTITTKHWVNEGPYVHSLGCTMTAIFYISEYTFAKQGVLLHHKLLNTVLDTSSLSIRKIVHSYYSAFSSLHKGDFSCEL